MFGISAALTTPFDDDGGVDFHRLNTHIKTVLNEGCASVTLFGTTGEGASVAVDLRLATLRATVDARINPADIIFALHGPAAADIVAQARAALDMGVTRFLLPPPCYFTGPTTAGLANWFGSVFAQLDGTGAQIILYHIPQVIGVGLPIDLVVRLKANFADLVLGVKDSSGSFENARELLALDGLEILIGDERQLAACARLGAAGAISGVANLFSARLAKVLASRVSDPQLDHLVNTALKFPVTPAIKSLVAHRYGAPQWRRTCAPLEATPDTDYAVLVKAFDAVDATAQTG